MLYRVQLISLFAANNSRHNIVFKQLTMPANSTLFVADILTHIVALRQVEDDRNSSTNRKNFRVKSNRSQSKGKIEVSQSIIV